MKHASHVVVDIRDGYTFWSGSDGKLFNQITATQFADLRNAEMKPEHRTYIVFALLPVLSAEWLAHTISKADPEAGKRMLESAAERK